MAANIFITGATGYIGGDILHHLYSQQLDVSYTLLIRSEERATKILEKYPTVRVIIGSLDDSDILVREASHADIVIHAADSSDHVGAATAIAKGLVEGHSPGRPGFWLHISGTGILTYFDSESNTYGEPNDKVFNDYEGVEELVNLPAAAFHRNVDEIVLRAGTDHADSVKTAIISPPTIYGLGRGPGSSRSRQVYALASFVLTEQYCPRSGKGLSRWNHVHIQDLSLLFELLVKAALDPSQRNNREIWGPHGYFLAENGEHVWGEVSAAIGEEAHKQGFISGGPPEIRALSFDDAVQSAAGFTAATWGLNSRATAVRARKILAWKPCAPSLDEELPNIVQSEAQRLGL